MYTPHNYQTINEQFCQNAQITSKINAYKIGSDRGGCTNKVRAAASAYSWESLNLYKSTDPLIYNKDDKKAQREQHLQHAVVTIKERFGKNAVLRGFSF